MEEGGPGSDMANAGGCLPCKGKAMHRRFLHLDSARWYVQVTDKRAFYSLQTGGPATFAITLDKGNVKWVW